jgi:hypothetical protein
MIKSLGDLRARRKQEGEPKKKNSWAFEAAMAAMAWTSLALAVTYLMNGSWLGAGLGLVLGFIGLCIVFVVASGALSVGWEKQADFLAYFPVLAALGAFSHGRFEHAAWLPLGVSFVTWVFHGARYRAAEKAKVIPRDSLPEDVAQSLVALPESLDTRLQAPLDRALLDCAALQKVAAEAQAAGGAYAMFGIDPVGLVDDAHTTLREMSRRATSAQALSAALADGASASVREALDAAVAGLEKQADEIRGAREAWLLFDAAQVDEKASRIEGLRRRADALRAMGSAIREVEGTLAR